MTDPTPQPGADPGLPVPTLRDLQSRAYRLHCLIDALDLINDSAPLFYPEKCPEQERRAMNAMIPMIEILKEYSGDLVVDLDIFAGAHGKVTA